MVRSRLEYCCPLWNPHKIGDIQNIEAVQKSFTRKIAGMKDMDYWERLSCLNITSLQRRRERYIIIHVFKIMNNLAPNDLSLEGYTNNRLGQKLKTLPLNTKATKYATTLMENSFRIQATKLWNILPADTNTIKDLDKFKVSLGNFMEKIPDRPPVRGYTTQNNNSLIDWSNQSGGRSKR